jgi:multiple sugar transport system ATP-binding protein
MVEATAKRDRWNPHVECLTHVVEFDMEGTEDHATEPPSCDIGDERSLEVELSIGVADDNVVAVVGESVLDPAGHHRVERVGDVGYDERDSERSLHAQIPRDPVRPKSELRDCFFDNPASCRGNRAIPREDMGHRRGAHASPLPDIGDRGRSAVVTWDLQIDLEAYRKRVAVSIASLPRHAVVKAPQSIRLEGLTRIFQGGVRAVDDVDLAVSPGEFLVLVGPSGCGKSTLLRMVAGLEEVTDGTVFVGDQDVTDLAPRERDIAMVFQNYALYPHMSVRRNLEHPLRMQHVPKEKREERVRSAAAMLGLDELLERRPTALSGGQRQRVAMGRAIVREPKAFLMDEPLSNLDAKLRVSMRAELRALHERLGTTTLYVTHDQVEAMTLGHRVAVMREGKIVQLGTPQDLYRDPTDLFVAAFVGSPAMNLLHARRDGEHLAFGQHRLQLDGRLPDDQTFVCGIRPEHIADATYAPATWPRVDAEIALVEDVGSVINVAFLVDARPADVVEEADPTHHVTTVIAALDHRSTPRPGKSMTLAFDPNEFHYFQPSGERIARTSR